MGNTETAEVADSVMGNVTHALPIGVKTWVLQVALSGRFKCSTGAATYLLFFVVHITAINRSHYTEVMRTKSLGWQV